MNDTGAINVPSAGYYQCGVCGQSVPYGGTHYCQPLTYSYPYYVLTLDSETKELLKRIAAALEKMAGK